MKQMKKLSQMKLSMLMILVVTVMAGADTVITRDGASYSGRFLDAAGGTISFTDAGGIQYTFPLHDVQSMVFTETNDIVTLLTERSIPANIRVPTHSRSKTPWVSSTSSRARTWNRWC
jgi:hypothetical protein